VCGWQIVTANVKAVVWLSQSACTFELIVKVPHLITGGPQPARTLIEVLIATGVFLVMNIRLRSRCGYPGTGVQHNSNSTHRRKRRNKHACLPRFIEQLGPEPPSLKLLLCSCGSATNTSATTNTAECHNSQLTRYTHVTGVQVHGASPILTHKVVQIFEGI
jgi:hypothetical protein